MQADPETFPTPDDILDVVMPSVTGEVVPTIAELKEQLESFPEGPADDLLILSTADAEMDEAISSFILQPPNRQQRRMAERVLQRERINNMTRLSDGRIAARRRLRRRVAKMMAKKSAQRNRRG